MNPPLSPQQYVPAGYPQQTYQPQYQPQVAFQPQASNYPATAVAPQQVQYVPQAAPQVSYSPRPAQYAQAPPVTYAQAPMAYSQVPAQVPVQQVAVQQSPVAVNQAPIRGESRIEYVPYQRAVMEYEEQEVVQYVPIERKVTDYYAVEYQTEYVPQVFQEKYTGAIIIYHILQKRICPCGSILRKSRILPR